MGEPVEGANFSRPSWEKWGEKQGKHDCHKGGNLKRNQTNRICEKT